MKHKFLLTGLAVLMATGGPGAPALAGGSDIVGGVIGGIIGGAIVNEANRSNQRRTTTTTRTYAAPRVSSAQREANREVQVALNHFGWNVGTPDGSLGPKSRAGISQYQAFMEFPITGRLNDMERTILTTAYQKAMLGGSAVTQTISAHPQGMRGLLLETRAQMLGTGGATYAGGSIGGLPPQISEAVYEIARSSNVEPQQLIARSGFVQLADLNNDGRTDYLLDTSVLGPGFWCNDKSCAVRVFASTPSGFARNDFQAYNAKPAMFICQAGACQMTGDAAPAASLPPTTMAVAPQPQPQAPSFGTQLAAQPVPAMPSFAAMPEPVPVSLASYCAKVGLVTSSNGGFLTEASLTDPGQALGEQFCLARGYAIDEGEAMAAKITGFTPDQIAAQCRDFGALLSDQVAAVGTTPQPAMIEKVKGFVAGSGMSPAQLSGTAKVCLSVGYRTDDMPVALGSALVLGAIGEGGYDELVGHHLMQGVGTDERPDLALGWYESGIKATPVFAPGQPERNGLIHKAALMMNGRADASAAPKAASGPAASLAGFASKAAQLIETAAPQ